MTYKVVETEYPFNDLVQLGYLKTEESVTMSTPRDVYVPANGDMRLFYPGDIWTGFNLTNRRTVNANVTDSLLKCNKTSCNIFGNNCTCNGVPFVYDVITPIYKTKVGQVYGGNSGDWQYTNKQWMAVIDTLVSMTDKTADWIHTQNPKTIINFGDFKFHQLGVNKTGKIRLLDIVDFRKIQDPTFFAKATGGMTLDAFENYKKIPSYQEIAKRYADSEGKNTDGITLNLLNSLCPSGEKDNSETCDATAKKAYGIFMRNNGFDPENPKTWTQTSFALYKSSIGHANLLDGYCAYVNGHIPGGSLPMIDAEISARLKTSILYTKAGVPIKGIGDINCKTNTRFPPKNNPISTMSRNTSSANNTVGSRTENLNDSSNSGMTTAQKVFILLVIVALLGVGGWFGYKHFNKV